MEDKIGKLRIDASIHIHGAKDQLAESAFLWGKIRCRTARLPNGIFLLQKYSSVSALLKIIHSRGIRGIILGRFSVEHEAIVTCPLWSNFSVVACGMGYADPPFHCVIPNFHRSITLGVKRFQKRGVKKIGLVIPTFNAHNNKLSLHDGYKYSAFFMKQA